MQTLLQLGFRLRIQTYLQLDPNLSRAPFLIRGFFLSADVLLSVTSSEAISLGWAPCSASSDDLARLILRVSST